MGEIFIRGLELPLTVRGVTVLDEDGNYNVYIIAMILNRKPLSTN